jgi:translation initiation factor IF-3
MDRPAAPDGGDRCPAVLVGREPTASRRIRTVYRPARAPSADSCGRPFGSTRQETTAIRRPFRAAAPTKEGPRVNREIRVPEVQLISDNGENMGVVAIADALAAASEAGLDLVEISPNSNPPVCKILDVGKFKYQSQKKASEARKNQKIVEIKEVKMRPNIDTHDYEVKMKNIQRFFEEGDKVKVTLRFRGREMAHQDLGIKLLQQVRDETSTIAKVESEPRLEGRQMVMVLAPR